MDLLSQIKLLHSAASAWDGALRMAQIRAETLEVPLCPPRLVLEPADVERQGTGGRTVECGCPEPCHFDRVNTL